MHTRMRMVRMCPFSHRWRACRGVSPSYGVDSNTHTRIPPAWGTGCRLFVMTRWRADGVGELVEELIRRIDGPELAGELDGPREGQAGDQSDDLRLKLCAAAGRERIRLVLQHRLTEHAAISGRLLTVPSSRRAGESQLGREPGLQFLGELWIAQLQIPGAGTIDRCLGIR